MKASLINNRRYRATVDDVSVYILPRLQMTLGREGITLDTNSLQKVKQHGTKGNVLLFGCNMKERLICKNICKSANEPMQSCEILTFKNPKKYLIHRSQIP